MTRRKEALVPHMAAAACTGAILFFLACLLLYMPAPRQSVRHDESLQVYFLPRQPLTQPAPAVPPTQAERRPPAAASTARAAPPPTRTPPPQRQVAAANASANDAMAAQLYTREGRLRMPPDTRLDPLAQGAAVPPGMTDARAQAKARSVMERVNPVQYQQTRFAKDWKSDGTLGDVAMQEMDRGMKKFNDMLNGPQTQVTKARPPPDVRFNPALAGNQADLGSEATGDAYKAAPIAHESPPDLKGEASRRIRDALASLEQRSARCAASRRTSLLSPVRTHLSDLERAEHALNNGADPVMAAQLLPRQADNAYDMARRALWYADRQLKQCAVG
ncbi:hypothetical protein XcodCFBP4690_02265 [Xanthomonas codiaei]|uniref:Uncharacterized protein n=1 Tax=Xanthomonas codiaei TaxID=56463 RepID=A0A2S7CY96_9XANT|nr:hypothetical protein XcodCFBP4690_02265 [Xanthomonas codiaei]